VLSDGLERLPDLEFFENLALDCDDDVFFEIFVIILKNASLSFQSNFYRTKNRQKNRIRSEILILKENFNANCDEIFEKELQLSEIIELELKEELSQIKNFERLNDEKITPYFLKLAKTPTQSESLETICDDDGVPFDSNVERSLHIHRYYKSSYKKPLQLNNGPDISIESFLGECSNEPDVINSKISDEEKNNLDRPLSIVELD
jgi:hypothetical protein